VSTYPFVVQQKKTKMSVSATNTSMKETRDASTQTENSDPDVEELRRRPFEQH